MLSFLFKNPIFNNTTYVILILGIIGAFIVGHWFWSQKKQRDVIQAIMKKTAAAATVIDRPPLVEEPIQLIPANEIYNLAYKNVDCKENELYAPDAPLYSSTERLKLVVPAINSTQRRVNFLEV